MPETTEQLERYLHEMRIPLRLACQSQKGWPLVLSLWYLFDEGKIYCATQETALVVQRLRQDGRCAFEVAGDLPPYCGVRGQGRATIDEAIGVEILERLLLRYGIIQDSPLARRLLSRGEGEVAIVIEPLNWYSWDFTERMKDSVALPPPGTICP
jgi:hypothetical protein